MSHKKYSSGLVMATAEFLRACKLESGDDFSDEQIYAMIDAFDPALKHQMFLEMLMGNIGHVSVVYTGGPGYPRKKIPAIKAIRTLTGLGLKEAKHLADKLDAGDKIHLEGSYSSDQINQFKDELKGTGYEVV